jgi:spore coat polysaccharide biosynthesis protein SpsF (cytidylyltransferase family)
MKPIAIIQARMGSSRLPGKVLMPLANKPVLAHVVERLGMCRTLQGVVVATSTDLSDDVIEKFCATQDIRCYRGSLEDVLDRYYQSALLSGANPIVRITADCPVIDPVVVDAVVTGFLAGNYDFYGLAGEFPDGLDCTVFGFAAIERAWKEARLKSEREHVGPYIENHPEIFRNGGLQLFSGLAHHRWTLDEPRDYALLSAIFDRLYQSEKTFLINDILQLLALEPELITGNAGIVRNAGYLKSLENDGVVKS